MKNNTSSSPILALPDLRQPFEIQTDASDYAMGTILLQHGKPISFHSEMFNGAVINYPTYDKELYTVFKSVKKWKHYFMGRKPLFTMITNRCNTCNHKPNCSSQGTFDGWDSSSNSTWLSCIRKVYTTRLLIFFLGLLLMQLL